MMRLINDNAFKEKSGMHTWSSVRVSADLLQNFYSTKLWRRRNPVKCYNVKDKLQ